MAYDPKLNDPYLSETVGDNLGRRIDPVQLDNELQPDPELAEGPAGGGKIAMFALGIALVLGAVFYGLNNSSVNPTGPTTAQNSTQTSPPAAPGGMRDVTPRANNAPANTAPGVTTGAAPATPQTPPSSTPTGADLNRSGNPPTTDTSPAAK